MTNYVKGLTKKETKGLFTVGALRDFLTTPIQEFRRNTAFIGYVSDFTHERGLYLITFGGIVEANNPRRCWSSPGTQFTVEKFVDIEITIKE